MVKIGLVEAWKYSGHGGGRWRPWSKKLDFFKIGLVEALTFKLDTVAVVVVVAAAGYGDNKAPQAGIWVLGSGLALHMSMCFIALL